MIAAHIMGLPIEESVLQVAPAGAAIVTAVVIASRTTLSRLQSRLRRRSPSEDRQLEELDRPLATP